MTPEIITRSFTNDQLIFDKVFFDNKYKLKGHNKEAKKVFADIGAHAGFFTFAALTLGAKKVYSFEPYIDSFNVLLKNTYTHAYPNRVTPYNVGVYTTPILGKFDSPKLIDGVYFDLAGVGLATGSEQTYYPCQCEYLTTLLREYCFNEQIDVLKINIGYAEREILLGSLPILKENVVSVCGEVTANDQELLEFKKTIGLNGFINFYSNPVDVNGRVQFWASQHPLEDNFNLI